MVRCVASPRGALSIHVSAKVLSGASLETGILGVRRFNFWALPWFEEKTHED